ncbi:MAG: hypothetical protein KDD47_21970 [Acidobacteria bacterium]|nr:hypothetical protein [Acidobacteriota bacterium]
MKQPEPNPVEVYLQGLSARNMRTSLEALDLMAQRLTWKTGPKGGKRSYDGLTAPWWLLTSEEVVEVREQLVGGEWISETTGEPFTPTAVNRFLAALRGVMRQCWLQGLMPAAAYLDSVAKLKSVSPVPSRAARD